MVKLMEPDFSQLVTNVRTALGFNRGQFSQLLGVTPAAVFLWEKGERRPEGPALRLLYAFNESLQHRKPRKSELEEVLKAIAVGTAVVGFIALLATLFSVNKK